MPSEYEEKKIFAYDEALRILPEVQRRTQAVITQITVITAQIYATKNDEERIAAYKMEQADLANKWVQDVEMLGAEVKGLWLVDFDNGEGYYCWQHPESTLEYFHEYTKGFAGRTRLF